MSISLLCPTRKRPEFMQRVWQSAQGLADAPDQLELIFYIDNDDPAALAQAVDMNVRDPQGVHYVVGPRIVLSSCWNEAYKTSRGSILMHCGDDVVFRTAGWDTLVRSAFSTFPDHIVLVYGRDGIHDEVLGTHSFIHRDWVNQVGYFVPPYFSSDYNDTWLNDVATRIGRRLFLPDLFIEHMHFTVGKHTLDETHRDRLARHVRDQVAELYTSLESLRAADAARLQTYINNFKATL